MSEEKYLELLKTAPTDHFSPEFKIFLYDNNRVVSWSEGWLIICNKKYWTPENDWLTAFYTGRDITNPGIALASSHTLLEKYGDREWLIKAPHKRTVKLFHIHLIKKQ